MIENVLEIKDTHVREVMTPLVDVVAIDASASLVDFHHMWVTHQYSRYLKVSQFELTVIFSPSVLTVI
jgi:CBS domain containing-hemolysin-like protein